jgi:hypothetical protein
MFNPVARRQAVLSKYAPETKVKRPREQIQNIPLHDYRPALQTAVSWLGNRYLLAEPARRLNDEQKPYFGQTRSWHPATHH